MIIQVAETHPPKAGKKLGTVKTATGESFGIWPDKLSALQVGGRYEIEFDESEFNGRTYQGAAGRHAIQYRNQPQRCRMAICLFIAECGHCGGKAADSD